MNEEFLNEVSNVQSEYLFQFDSAKLNSREFICKALREFVSRLFSINMLGPSERTRNLFATPKEKENQYYHYYNQKIISIIKWLTSDFNRQMTNYYEINYLAAPVETYEVLLSLDNDFVFDQVLSKERDLLRNCPKPIEVMDILYKSSVESNIKLIEEAKILLVELEKKFPILADHKISKLTHREHALIRKYMIQAKYMSPDFDRVKITAEFTKARERAIDSVSEVSTTFRAIKPKELESIIPHLQEFPNAQKAVINDLEKLRNRI